MESTAAPSINQLAAGLANRETKDQAITQILAAVEPLLRGRWRASLEARAPRMSREDREQVAWAAIWEELVRLTGDCGKLANILSLTAWLGAVAQSKLATAAKTNAETGISGTNAGRVQSGAAGIRQQLEQAGEPSTDADVVLAYNAGRRKKTRAITVADLAAVRNEELSDDLGIRSAIGLVPTAAQLDVRAAINLLPLEQRRAVGLHLAGETLTETAVEMYGDPGQRSRVDRLIKAALSALRVSLYDYAPMPAAA